MAKFPYIDTIASLGWIDVVNLLPLTAFQDEDDASETAEPARATCCEARQPKKFAHFTEMFPRLRMIPEKAFPAAGTETQS